MSPGLEDNSSSERFSEPQHNLPNEKTTIENKEQTRRATRARKISIIISSICLVLSVIFLILVETGNVTRGSAVARKTYFIKLDTTNVIPVTIPNAYLVNSIAQSIGLHDFYQVGLWNYCSGYNNEGITYCSDPKLLYWFNPIDVLRNDLLQGAVIQLPDDIGNALELLRVASNIMFGFFLTGAVLATVMAGLGFLALYSRLFSLLVTPLTFLAGLFIVVGAVLATVIFIVLQKAVTSISEINLGASLGVQMLVFVWLAAVFALIPSLIHICLLCCCTSRRKNRHKTEVA